jgi:SAM-dependent methyltransferase
VAERFRLHQTHRIVEVASNDGYLLQHFVARGLPVLGIEPAANVAAAARARGIPTETRFFGKAVADHIARRDGPADLLIANNVLPHVPDLKDFIGGLARLLSPDGVLTLEFPHLLQLIAQCQFDTIYHEHFSYFSLLTAERALGEHGLQVFDVEELPTHGGSLRLYVQHADPGCRPDMPGLERVRDRESDAGLHRLAAYGGFEGRARAIREDVRAFLEEARSRGQLVAGYGAPGKGNTLLHYCGVGPDLLAFTVDRNPYKQGKCTPGTHIPIHAPARIFETRPAYVLILPWNLETEIVHLMAGIRAWGGRFVVPIPFVRVFS